MAVLENHWIAEQARENDRLAARDDALDELERNLYFDALRELADDGKLQDARMHAELDDALFAGHDGGIDPTEVLKLVGQVHRVSSLDHAARERACAALGRYLVDLVEKHLNPLVDADARRRLA